MIRIQDPNGDFIEFPDGTDDETIRRVMEQQFPSKRAKAPSNAEPSMGPFINDPRPAKTEGHLFDPIAQAVLDRDWETQ